MRRAPERRRDAVGALIHTIADQAARKERIGPLIDDVIITVHLRMRDIRRALRGLRTVPRLRRTPRTKSS